MNNCEPDNRPKFPDKKHLLSGLFLVVATPFLFFDPFGLAELRLTPFLWDLGHIPLYFAVGWFLLGYLQSHYRLKFLSLFVTLNAIAVLLGLLIEEVQQLQGRHYSFMDIYLNCLGVSLALAFHPSAEFKHRVSQTILRFGVAALLLVALIPVTKHGVDWIAAKSSFPILSDFESTFELERWKGKELAIIELEGGNRVLSHQFDVTQYSSLYFNHVPGDWLGYDCFRFQVINPAEKVLHLTVRIHDRMHRESGYDYNDRFNLSVRVSPGVNDYKVTLDAVSSAPRDRSMNLEEISEVIFFTITLDEKVTLYFDNIELGTC